jgi:hypothetical protein
VQIRDSDGNIWLYAHLQDNSASLKEGDSVLAGQQIGVSDETTDPGKKIDPHLHLEFWRGGQYNFPEDPNQFFKYPPCDKKGEKKLPVSAVSSLDPNAKFGSTGADTARYVTGTHLLTYGVAFDNQPSATAPAQTVVVTDQLNVAVYDVGTFALGSIAFGTTTVSPPTGVSQYNTDVDLRPGTNLIVRINAGLDTSTGLVTWRFTSIDPATMLPVTDPLAGFLPPDTSPPNGEGSVLFTVSPRAGLATGTQIQNQATVVFDQNAPITTQPWSNTIDAMPPTSHVQTQPATETSPSFQVQWSGTDVGAGIQDFTIYVSQDGGPFTIWQANTTSTSATYTGQPGHSYAFYSIARDLVGNVEVTKSAAEAQTAVLQTTAVTYSGPTSQDYHDAVTVTGTLTATPQNTPLVGQTLSFTLGSGGGSQLCSGVTDATGSASCSITPTDAAGSSTIQVSFAGTSAYQSSSDSKPFTITKEETALSYMGPTTIANGQPVTLSAVLKEDGTTPIGGRTVAFSLGSQSCTGSTGTSGNQLGVASCAVTVSQPLGPGAVQASFSGDGDYQAAQDSKPIFVFAYLASGAFVVGDQSTTGSVTYWSAQWEKQNSLSGGGAPNSFKGFAASTSSTPPGCGAGAVWTTGPGNSAGPPSSVPSYMAVLVTSSASKSGSTISGNTVHIVVVQTDAGYASDPGHAGTGKVVAQVC